MTEYKAKKYNNTQLVKCNIKSTKSDNTEPAISSSRNKHLASKI